MGIVYCENCEGKCSDIIESCPHCGHPIVGNTNDKKLQKEKNKKVQTIEKTGKKNKLFTLIGMALMIWGIILLNSDGNEQNSMYGSLLVVFGLIIIIIARVFSWWFHG